MLTSEKLDHSHSLLQFAMGYLDKLKAFRFGIKIHISIIKSFSVDCHVQTHVHGLAIRRSSELRYLKGVENRYIQEISHKVQECSNVKSQNRTSRIKTKRKYVILMWQYIIRFSNKAAFYTPRFMTLKHYCYWKNWNIYILCCFHHVLQSTDTNSMWTS